MRRVPYEIEIIPKSINPLLHESIGTRGAPRPLCDSRKCIQADAEPVQQRAPQLLDGVESLHPEQLLLERANGALDAAVSLRRTHECGLDLIPRDSIFC